MGEVSPASEPSLLATVDFRAFVETVRLRWWVVPLTVALAIGFLQAQESDLRTEPASFVVSRSYEVGSPYKSLNAIGINLIVSEFPDPQTQLLVLKSSEVRAEIDEKLGKEVEVQVPENWETPFTFTCNQPVKEDCVRAIDSYVEKVVELREDAIVTGVENLRAVLLAAQEKSPDPLVARQLVALDALSGNVQLPIALIDSMEQSIGPTVEDVRRPTALMGAAAGLLIGLLILLQLTFTDSRVRSARQLVRLTGVQHFLGGASSKPREVADRRVALGLHQQMSLGGRGRVRYLPLRKPLSNTAPMERLAAMAGAQPVVVKPFSELSVTELADPTPDEVDVLVVQRNRDLRKDVVEAVVALSKSGRRFAGVLLVD